MKLLRDEKYAVERAVLEDALKYEQGELVFDEEDAVAVKACGVTKCVFKDAGDYRRYADKYGIRGNVCVLGAPSDAARVLFDAEPCITYAYLDPLPPPVDEPNGVVIKRLAPTLAETVVLSYGKYYTVTEMARLMRERGVFGAVTDGKLAGFIGRHTDGNMGMITVDGKYRRRGIGSALERFMINYVMTFGRIPILDVFVDNAPSIAMQCKLGMRQSSAYTFWGVEKA